MKTFIFIIIQLFIVQVTIGQYAIGLVPRVSPDKRTFEKVGYTDIEIKYGSPSIKNRTIGKEIAPFGKVWRAGANEATNITFSEDVEINGQTLVKGQYALFIIPTENEKWTFIFNKKHKQWGAFGYDEAEDALRVETLPMSNDFQEKLTYSIESRGFEYAHIFLEWANIKVGFEVKTDYTKILKRKIEETVATVADNRKWVVYLQGAEYLVKQQKSIDLAAEWIIKSEELKEKATEWDKRYYPQAYILGHLYWVKAQVLAYQENYKDALEYVEQLKAINTPEGSKYNYYNRKKEREEIDEKVELWEKEAK